MNMVGGANDWLTTAHIINMGLVSQFAGTRKRNTITSINIISWEESEGKAGQLEDNICLSKITKLMAELGRPRPSW